MMPNQRVPNQPRPINEIQRDVMRGKRVSATELNRFARHPKGQMMLQAMRGRA